MKNYLIYLLLINIFSFILALTDKSRAKNKKWRISENALLFSAIIGGGVGLLLGLLLSNHKTRRKKFMIGVPVIIVLHFVVVSIFLY